MPEPDALEQTTRGLELLRDQAAEREDQAQQLLLDQAIDHLTELAVLTTAALPVTVVIFTDPGLDPDDTDSLSWVFRGMLDEKDAVKQAHEELVKTNAEAASITWLERYLKQGTWTVLYTTLQEVR